jgi:superoxide dismutase, Cu-Zn family
MRLRRGLAGVLGVLVLAGCANTTEVQPTSSPSDVRSAHVSETFQSAPGTAVTYDTALVPVGARGAVQSRSGDGTTTVMLAVRGLEPTRWYGAHVHNEPCGERPGDAGPHFQSSVDPVQPSVDPTYANPQNEIWLDLTTDESGAGSAESTVTWTFPDDRRPGSVVVHAMQTATAPGEAGTAGDRAACITVEF